MKIVTLIENTTQRETLTAEHGLSLYLQTQDHRILFDTGATGAFADNAEKLGVNLAAVDFAVLSHGHYDHGGGLHRFLQCNTHAPVYVNQYAFESHYNAKGSYIGLPPSLQHNARLCSVSGSIELVPGVNLAVCPPAPVDTAGLTVMEKDVLYPEDFRHEQYLLVEEKGKRILFSGCSHKGIRNIIKYFRPDVLVGGFHFMKVEDEAFLRQAAQELLQSDTVYYTGHCTGEKQYAIMKQIMGQRLHYLATGDCVEL